jgi:site-specific DNA-methyltransferase (adenine-specific)
MRSEVFNEDCMAVMSRYTDKWFELAVVDVPYGIGEDGLKNHSRGNATRPTLYTPKDWDSSTPDKDYFDELIRVSRNQIIWGANHFISKIPYDSSCWLVWDKQNGNNDFADCELAWTSFDTSVRQFQFRWAGMLQGNMKQKEHRIHPTQKPVALYDWIFKNYAKPTDKILDTHLGSGSSRIAAHRAGLDFTGCEIDKDYFDAAEQRYRNFTAQLRLF